MSNAAREVDVDKVIAIVVGSHLRAEIDDRPLAYRLRDCIGQRLGRNEVRESSDLKPVVCTDVWYLNNQELLARPAIAIGDPGVNAATAYLSNRLPTALVVDHSLRIHLDPEFVDVQACLWGAGVAATSSALDVFIERYLEQFLNEAALS